VARGLASLGSPLHTMKASKAIAKTTNKGTSFARSLPKAKTSAPVLGFGDAPMGKRTVHTQLESSGNLPRCNRSWAMRKDKPVV